MLFLIERVLIVLAFLTELALIVLTHFTELALTVVLPILAELAHNCTDISY
jgi:hypothetical protein